MSSQIQIDEGNSFYKQFVDCVMLGAALQDIYVNSQHGFAARDVSVSDDPQLQQKLTKAARKEFLRINAHTLNLVNPIDRHIGLKGKRVLDFGCGTGALAVALALKDAQVTAVDPTPLSLQASKYRAQYFGLNESNFTTVQVQPQPGLPFEPQSFDIITTNSVFEFIPHYRKEYVWELLQLLKPGGILVISTENGLFPVDYYTRQWFMRLRRKHAVANNVPYGLDYFELCKWVRGSPRQVSNLCPLNLFNSVDKLVERKRSAGQYMQAGLVGAVNTVFKGVCRAIRVPSDIVMPYATYIFRVEA